jgi:D-Tyr-tRNAtyr deacylase
MRFGSGPDTVHEPPPTRRPRRTVDAHVVVETGVLGAKMEVDLDLVDDGPVTIALDG